jgi:hypothetical protein
MTRDEFFATFPYVTNPVSFIDPYMLLDMQYLNRDTIIVHDSFRKEWYPLEIVYLSNGMDVTEAQWEEAQKAHQEQLEITEGSIVSEIIKNGIPRVVGGRQTQDYEIMHYRMTRDQIIDFSKWPSRQLPIPFVDGNSDYIEGRQYTKSYIHEARDSQKLHNYAMSQLAGDLKNRRREQWMGTPDNIKGNEQMWRNPEVQMGILTAIPDPKSGLMPQKTPASEVPQGLFMTGQATAQDIHEILGVSTSEELGSRDVSGKSRRERKMEVSASTYVWFDNMNQAIEQGARVYSDLLPHIIGDEEMRMMRTRKDGRSESITLNSRDKDGKVVNSIGEGDFDVEIDTGPSFAVQKDVALEFLAQTIQAYPQSFPLVADLWAKNLDVQFGPQIADRFKTLVPPQILAKEEGKPPPPPQPDPQAQMMQAEMQLKQSQMQAKMKEVQIKEQELQLKMQQLELDKQKMMLEAQKDAMDSQLDVFNHKADLEEVKLRHHLDSTKADNDFALGLAGHLTDLHKHHHPVESKKAE